MRPAAATGTVTQDGITLSVTTDKDSYDAGETVDITASLTSENKNIDGTLTVDAVVPAGISADRKHRNGRSVPEHPEHRDGNGCRYRCGHGRGFDG